MKQFVSGASDDIIQLSGPIDEEHPLHPGVRQIMHFSDGTKARIGYIEGLWEIKVVKSGPLFQKLVTAVGEDNQHSDPDAVAAKAHGRSDVLVLGSGITEVLIGRKQYKSEEE